MLPQLDVEDEFVANAKVPLSPLLRKMRGRVTAKVEQMIAARQNPANYGKPTPAPSTGTDKEQSWAMVLYKPPTSVATPTVDESIPSGRRPYPKPIAVRYCPPGMRIRGAIPMPTNAAPIPKKKIEKRKVDPVVTILSDSESEQEKVVPFHHSGASSSRPAIMYRLCTSKSAPLPTMKKPKVQVNDTAPEWKSPEARTRVKHFLRAFDNLRRQFMVDDQRAKEKAKHRAEEKAKQRVREKGKQRAKDAGAGTKEKTRPDLKAMYTLKGVAPLVNGSESIYGEVPGVEVGDHYYYRVELLMISLHRQMQGGIDYISESKSKFRDVSGCARSVAVSVIASGGYEDDRDEGDTLLYTGAGGNNYKGDKRQGEDQELARGNLALKNCYDLKLAVRVIRGCEYKRSPLHQGPARQIYKIYYYDGMYDVVDCFPEVGSSGFKVWKFKLVRKPGQGPRSSRLVPFQGKPVPSILEARGEKIISEDLSRGQERLKVRVVGCNDDDRPPDDFQYITSLKFAPGLPRPSPLASCACTRPVSQMKNTCSCPGASRVEQSYNEEGCLLRAKRLVCECGPRRCLCGSAGKCTNRVTQSGLRYDMEIFKTKGKGWGVRSSYFIPQGSFICEYIGEIIHESDAEKRVSNDEYMFDLKIPDSMERRFGHVTGLVGANDSSSERDDDDDDENSDKYTVDANRYGNLARFINHSCEPNLFVQCVLYDHHDLRFPHIMLFASEHISPYKELTYDYGYEVNTIKVNGKVKVKICYCNAPSCRGRLY